nr:enolase-like isoform X3 [Tanacetum cinerariifolium]
MGMMAEYQNEFEMIINRITRKSENLLASIYIFGLKPALIRALLWSNLTTLGEAFSLARIAKARYKDERATTTIAKPNDLNIVGKAYELNFKEENHDGSENILGGCLKNGYPPLGSHCLIMSIKDPFDHGDLEHDAKMTAEISGQAQIGSDDLLPQSSEDELGGTIVYAGVMFRACVVSYVKNHQKESMSIQIRLWDPGIKNVFQDTTLRARKYIVLAVCQIVHCASGLSFLTVVYLKTFSHSNLGNKPLPISFLASGLLFLLHSGLPFPSSSGLAEQLCSGLSLVTVYCSDIQCAGSDTRPPMLDRTDFTLWQQRIRFYCRGKENGVNILKSIDEGPFQMGMFRETLVEEEECALHLGFPKDIYTLINHYTDAKDIWDNVKMLLEGSELTKEYRESQLMQLNSKFVNNMLPEWGRFVTTVKLNRGLRDSNYDQLYAYLKQHKEHTNENKMMLDRFTQNTINPLALMSNISHQRYYLQSSTTPPSTSVQPYFADNTQIDLGLSLIDNLIENLTNTLAILTQSFKTYLPQTNNQRRTSSHTKNQATVQDGSLESSHWTEYIITDHEITHMESEFTLNCLDKKHNRFPFVYEQELSYNQNYNDNYYPHDLPSFPCCDNCGESHETFQCQPMDPNIDFSGSDQIQTPQYPEVHPPSQEISDEVFQVKGNLMKSIQTFLKEFNCIPFEEKATILLQAWFNFFAIKHDQPENSNELFQKLLEDWKELAEYKESLENSSKEIATSNSNQEKEGPPQDSDIRQLIREECCVEVCEEQKQNMEDTILELVEICRQKELLCMHDNVDDLIESALNTKLLSINSQRLDKKEQEVKNAVEKPAEHGNRIEKSLQNFIVIHKSSISLKNTSQIYPVHAVAPILSTKEPEYSTSMGMGYEYPNTTPKTESDEIIKSGVEELVPILSENEVTLEDKREGDELVCEDSSTFDICDNHYEIFSDSNNDDDISSDDDDFEDIEYVETSLSDPEIISVAEENVVYQEEEETRSGNTTHDHDSLPEYDSFCFEIEPDQERLINVVKNDISDDSSNDPLLKEADLFLASDNSIPPGIENFANDSEGDIRFLETLLSNDSIPFPNNESPESDFNNPSIPLPPPEPPDAEPDS